ncbi:LPS-assembly protein LptD [Alkalilimnicola ehrlichii MLHE-1]|uniref:LPS-assembly protein LptD n=1 Tax=Alkalilimnicola ehrlichii (strain ATCC BAA-1101 / DSM 17681 / MLHE-1) TaxID=187272 RepID=LPTD_ALKEH|nr:LPS assembly protein LptD [Alkalilimnicola ehrlichii]Q0AC83.1 RecName: Full=LPS-assembly protein LptD; Flags: Precursor [Alkalilimnicola ehrlichii MLHE-1]ABI55554.1 Organic solvent tolerance protein [Alkalilimnicola ehrlichii MLHE-1]
MRRLIPIAITGSLLWGAAVQAQGPTAAEREAYFAERQRALCGPPLVMPLDAVDTALRHRPETPATVDADAIYYDGAAGRYRFRGDVLMQRLDQRLRSEEVRYDHASGRVDLPFPFVYEEAGLALTGESGWLQLREDRGEVVAGEFMLDERNIRGRAERLELADAQRSRYEDVGYTTCRPGNEDWWLQARELELDREEGLGTARHAWFTFLNVPLFYTPWITFPIDDRRRTGLLAPGFATSDRHGTDITVPVYWNIAPNYDATLVPRWIERRGALLGGEFRYLQEAFSGELYGEYLPNDSLARDDRWLLGIDHRGRLPRGWRYDADINRASDGDYLRDFGSGLLETSSSHLQSRGRLRNRWNDWAVAAEVQHWQTLDDDLRNPYRREPRLTADYQGPFRAGQPRYRLNTEYTRFALPDTDADRPEGERMDIAPRVEWRLHRPWGYLTPAAALRHTQYRLDDPVPGADDRSPRRTVPTFSVDSGLFFDRPFDWDGRPMVQTLEPRVFYVYTPERRQDDLPVFDTSRRDFFFDGLFREDRFSGADRVGDADQVTVALTTRFVDLGGGREWLRASLGQIHYRRDRQVTLFPETDRAADRRSRSDYMAEMRSELPGGVLAQGEYRYNPYDSRSEQGAFRLGWHPRPDLLVGAGYRMRYGDEGRDVEQSDLAAVIPLGPRFSLIGRWLYSLADDNSLETVGGLEYRTCCWRVRAMGRRSFEGAGAEPDTSIMLQFEFTGLGQVDSGSTDFLQDSIYGYEGDRF